MKPKLQLADLQLAIMQVLWQLSEASVAQVREALKPDRDLAHTTIATMLTKMERNGQVDHRVDGRLNIYRPLLTQDRVESSMLGDLYQRLFHGNLNSVVCHLLEDEDISQTELNQLKKLIREKEKELKSKSK